MPVNCLALRSVALIIALLILPLGTYAESAPSVRAHLIDSQTIEVVIKSKIKKKKAGQIVVTRALGNSNKFKPYLKFPYKGSRTVRFTETVSGVTQVRYKSRLTGKAASSWSKAVKVEISDPAEEDDSTPSNPPEVPVPSEPAPPSGETPTVNLPAGASACPRTEILKVFTLVNTARISNGLLPLLEHPALALSSQVFSSKMATNQKFSHDGWYENIINNGYRGSTAGQNIGYSSQLSASQMMNMWMNSPGHKANILSRSFSHIGIGCVQDKNNLAGS